MPPVTRSLLASLLLYTGAGFLLSASVLAQSQQEHFAPASPSTVAWGYSRDEAYMLTSVAGDVDITQLVDGNVGVQVIRPKAIFTAKR